MTPYVIQSNVKHPEYIDATIQACERANKFKVSVGVFQDRRGDIFVQNVTSNSLKYFGKNGLLFVASMKEAA